MLKKIRISGGHGEVSGMATHLKIVSASAPVRVNVIGRAGKTIMLSELRAPMAVEFGEVAERIEFQSNTDQILEIWYGMQPLEYLQLTAAGAATVKSKKVEVLPGKNQVIAANPRQSLIILSDRDINISGDTISVEWPILANEKTEIKTSGEIYASFGLNPVDYTLLSGPQLSVLPSTEVANANITDDIFFKGFIFLAPYSGEIKKINIDTGAVISLGNFNGAQIFKIGKAIYMVRAANLKTWLYKSEDGESFELKGVITAPGFNTNAIPTKNGLVSTSRNWLFYRVNQEIYAINTDTLETAKTGAINAVSLPALYCAQFDAFFRIESGDIRRIQKNATVSELVVQKISGNNFLSVTTNELGELIAISSAGIFKIDSNFNAVMIKSGGGSSVNYVQGTLGRVYFSTGKVLHYVDGDNSGQVTVSGDGVYPHYDYETKNIYLISGLSPQRKIEKINFKFPDFEPAQIKMLEYLI